MTKRSTQDVDCYASRSGAVRILCHDVARDGGTALSPLGVVFQQRTRDPDLSIEQNLVCHGALHGIGPHETHAHLVAELARVGLADRIRDKARFSRAARCVFPRGLANMRAAFSLTTLAYNLRRALNILGVEAMSAAVTA
jgi:hypothetical protein